MSGTKLARTLAETALYPEHKPRRPSPQYLANHHRMVVIEDRPCLVCGVRNSTLKDEARNPRGATALETHHHYIEWALINAIDLSKFNRKIVPVLRARTGDTATYGHDFTQEEMAEWIAGHEGNLWVLCSVCHRHSLVGIHAITGPIWGCQDMLIDGYDLTGYHAPSGPEAVQLTALPMTVGVALPPVADTEKDGS